jgi:hypothetical protein
MKNLKPLAVAFLTLALAVPFLAKDKIVESRWTATPIQVDGSNAEWVGDPLELEKGVAVNYAFKNDAEYLYIYMLFNDPKFLSSIDQTGMTVWINAEDKDKRVYGLRFYRKPVTPDQLIEQLEKEGQVLDEQKKQEIKSKRQYMLFACDALNKKGEPISHPAGTGIATYRMAAVGKGRALEFVAPLALLDDPAGQLKIDPARPFKVGFEWGGMTEEMKKARATQLGERGAQTNAGDVSLEQQIGSGEAGAFRAPSADLSAMARGPKKYDFWVSVKIAQNQ